MDAGTQVIVGVVGKPFGVAGACYVRPDPDVAHDFEPGTAYTTAAGELRVAGRHDHGNRLILTFEGVTSRDAAEGLRGVVLSADRDDVALDEDAWWAEDVVGSEVVDADGAVVGVVEGLADGPAHDYLVVARPDAGSVLVPAVAELVRIEAGRVVVTPVPGLLDPEEAEAAGGAPPGAGGSGAGERAPEDG